VDAAADEGVRSSVLAATGGAARFLPGLMLVAAGMVIRRLRPRV
jgi:hypothetical protein